MRGEKYFEEKIMSVGLMDSVMTKLKFKPKYLKPSFEQYVLGSVL